MFLLLKFGKKSTINGLTNSLCITNFLEAFVGGLCKAAIMAWIISCVALLNSWFGTKASKGCKVLPNACVFDS